jgi:NifU-like protein involved in Fe-S cluster formation
LLRTALIAAASLTLAGCVGGTFAEATQDVNQEYAMAQQLRDRCNATGDVDDCLVWYEFRDARSAYGPTYERGLDRWIANGPY